jgi:hypothetical protein
MPFGQVPNPKPQWLSTKLALHGLVPPPCGHQPLPMCLGLGLGFSVVNPTLGSKEQNPTSPKTLKWLGHGWVMGLGAPSCAWVPGYPPKAPPISFSARIPNGTETRIRLHGRDEQPAMTGLDSYFLFPVSVGEVVTLNVRLLVEIGKGHRLSGGLASRRMRSGPRQAYHRVPLVETVPRVWVPCGCHK